MLKSEEIVGLAEDIVASRKYWGTYWYCYTLRFRSTWKEVVDAVEELHGRHPGYLFLHSRFLWWRWVRVVAREWEYLLLGEGGI